MAASVLHTWLGAGRWSAQYALPAVAAGLAWPGRRPPRAPGHGSPAGRLLGRGSPAGRLAGRGSPAGRRLALAALLAGAPAAAWLRGRPRLDPVRFTLAYLADEAAYGAGVYRGALAERLADPLLPRFAWRPHPRHPARRPLP
jgi:hypothetical protein